MSLLASVLMTFRLGAEGWSVITECAFSWSHFLLCTYVLCTGLKQNMKIDKTTTTITLHPILSERRQEKKDVYKEDLT